MSDEKINDGWLSYKGTSTYSYERALNYFKTHVRNSPQKYASALKELAAIHSELELHQLADKLMQNFNEQMAKLECIVSEYGNNKSWIYWDLGKQYYLWKNPRESYGKYLLGDPLSTPEIQNEIVCRHIGWEIVFHNKSVFQTICLAMEHLLNRDYHLLHSYEYAEIGKIAVTVPGLHAPK